MSLWKAFSSFVKALRSAFSNKRTFEQFVRVCVGMLVRDDHAGVTSIVRALGLDPGCYRNLLHLFESQAWSTESLTKCWVSWVMKTFHRYKVNGRYVLVADGIKVPREGRKMPAVKSLHQESESNSKPTYIMGHSYQSIGLLTQHGNAMYCVPLASRIHEGVKFSNADKRTLPNKLAQLRSEVALSVSILGHHYLLADAYYACASIIKDLLASGDHLVTRVKSNTVGYTAADNSSSIKRRGRPKKYGDKIRLNDLFADKNTKFENGTIVGYGGQTQHVKYYSVILSWKPVGKPVKFVLVRYPNKGTCILMTTDLSLDPLQVVELYTKRFKIETAFKQSVHTIGAYAYHFWLQSMEPIERYSGNQHLHRKSEEYKDAVKDKIESYHRFVAIGNAAQGFAQYLSTYFPSEVYALAPWLRTNTKSGHPSEATVMQALRAALPEFLQSKTSDPTLRKITTESQRNNFRSVLSESA